MLEQVAARNQYARLQNPPKRPIHYKMPKHPVDGAERHRWEGIGWLRAAVLGADDAAAIVGSLLGTVV
jgi:hypothetical protein